MAPLAPSSVRVVPGIMSPGDHAYFDSLVARPDHWKSYSLRDQAQLLPKRDGGYAASYKIPLYINYDAAEDAAKVVIPPFVNPGLTFLAADIDASTLTIPLAGGGTSASRGIVIKIDDEIMMTEAKVDSMTLTVTRGVHGTAPAPHAAGTEVFRGGNSLANQVYLPMGTEDGHSYLTTWDAKFGVECRMDLSGLSSWKTFQFRARKDGYDDSPGIWFEVRSRFDGGRVPFKLPLEPDMLCAVDVRGYSNPVGPNVTLQEPLEPRFATFKVKPNTWTRYWVLHEQRTSDPTYTLCSIWVADEHEGPVQLFDQLQLVTYGIDFFNLEYNTSTYRLKEGRGDLTSHVKNVVILRDPTDISSLLVRP